METKDCKISLLVGPETCRICFDDNFKAEQMYYVALCNHKLCVECMKRFIEEKLLEGTVPICPYYQCESKLTLRSCVHFLTSKLKAMWEQRIEEEAVPVTERFYCPNPRCSALMSKTELSKFIEEDGSMGCFQCGERFCINCKVLWHSNLSCDNYKRLGDNPTSDDIKLKALANQKMWRQCEKCQHMIELSGGCIKVTCRCGYSFCYTCGAEWKHGGCPHRQSMLVGSGIWILFLVGLVYLIFFVLN
ncbi:IBR domain [Arabidopsis thaliana x Arabidopsis arenosa]|uniref:RBR-type E3 ubiquitin transferase n=1 Tax=Arabidopsis thaliana x Arabidopsis arenosa TaxID=1240361 RepID=A0A8T1ZJZ2_9BRAS|nr:IBR domain [Arabidopsis thaliana x Arabidopsis arenosa]